MKISAKSKSILFLMTLFLFISIYLIFNSYYVYQSIKLHNMITTGNVNDIYLAHYARNVAETRVRGCTFFAKIISLSCSRPLSEWAMGDYSRQLDEHLFWNTFATYDNNYKKLTHLDILNQRTDAFESPDDNDFFYSVSVKSYEDGSYKLDVAVWKTNENYKSEKIVSDIKNDIKNNILKEKEYQKNIKVLINLYDNGEGLDFIETLFDDYIK